MGRLRPVTILLFLFVTTIARADPATRPATQPDAIRERLNTPLDFVSLENLLLPQALALIGERAHLSVVGDWSSLNTGQPAGQARTQGKFEHLTPQELIVIACASAGVTSTQILVQENLVKVVGPD